MQDLRQLYDDDYSAWAEANAALLRNGEFSRLDIEHLLAELSDMGKSELRALESRLRVLLAHLLKWQFQYAELTDRWREFDGRSWRGTIVHQRTELKILLRRYPGMQRLWPTALQAAYSDARELAAAETGLPIERFPPDCPYPEASILDDAFLPPTGGPD
jgi:DNA-binding transcriptional ArsR family regulator